MLGTEANHRVIDDNLIKESLEQELNGKKPQAKDFLLVKKLSFSYKNIIKIQSLNGLEALERLRIDNNQICEIENLDHLKNLKWLDLSFNNIKKIENLQNLTNLSELTLYNNQIETISPSSLRPLKKLSLLSLSNNKISDIFELLRSIKPLKNLEVLSISGNPLTSDNEYKNYVYANLCQLRYLDYTYIEESMRNGADDCKYTGDFTGVDGKDKVEKDEEDGGGVDEMAIKLRRYNLISYDRYLLSDNEDLGILLAIKSCFEESTSKLNENLKTCLETMKLKLVDLLADKNGTIRKFENAFQQMVEENEKEAHKFVSQYEQQKKVLTRYLQETNKNDKSQKIKDIIKNLEDLDDRLLQKQMMLKQKLKKSYIQMEANLKSTYNSIETVMANDGLKQAEEFLIEFFQKFVEEALLESEHYCKFIDMNGSRNSFSNDENLNEGEEMPWTEQQQSLLENKEELKNTISSIREAVENKHRAVDSLIRKEIGQERSNYFAEVVNKLKELNRQNVNNIINLVLVERELWTNTLKEYL